jgi:hypothetical protein
MISGNRAGQQAHSIEIIRRARIGGQSGIGFPPVCMTIHAVAGEPRNFLMLIIDLILVMTVETRPGTG